MHFLIISAQPETVARVKDALGWMAEGGVRTAHSLGEALDILKGRDADTIGGLIVDPKFADRAPDEGLIELRRVAPKKMLLAILRAGGVRIAPKPMSAVIDHVLDMDGLTHEKMVWAVQFAEHRRKKSDVRLRNSRRYRHFTLASTDWLWEMDSELRFSYLSPHFEAATGLQTSAVIGLSRPDLIRSVREPGAYEAHLEQLRKHEPFSNFQYVTEIADGKEAVFELSGVPVFSSDGSFEGYRGTGANVTERIRAEERERENAENLRAFLNATPDPAALIDLDFKVLLVNDAMARWRQKPAQAILGETFFDHPQAKLNRQRLSWIREVIARRNPVKGVVTVRGAWFEDNYYPVFDDTGKVTRIAIYARNISAERAALEDLRRSEMRFTKAFMASPNLMVISTLKDGVHFDVNDAWINTLGYSREEALGHTAQEIGVWPSLGERERFVQAFHANQGAFRDLEVQFCCKSGEIRDFLLSGEKINLDDSEDDLVLLVAHDITERKRVEKQLRLGATVYDNTTEAIMVSDSDNNIIDVNPAFTTITGYSREEGIGRKPSMLQSGRHDKAFYEAMWTTLLAQGNWQGEVWNRRKNGELYPEWLSISVIENGAGAVDSYVALFSDISKLKQDEERIRYQANYDALTGLPNRTLFMDRLWQTLEISRRENRMAALMFIDLDHFKLINDTLGHAAGDMLLQEVSRRLTNCVRGEDTVSRLGGDEFTITLPSIAKEMAATVVSGKVLAALSEPLFIDGAEVHVTASIGITLFPRDGDTPEELLKNADAAMYRAKDVGRNTYQFFTMELQEQVLERMLLEREMRHAITRDELELYYQPLVCVQRGRVIGAEVLLRWNHAVRGQIAPADFIPLAEETGLIVDIGKWVLEQACARLARWNEEGIAPDKLAINLSVRQFKQGNLLEIIQDVMERHSVGGHLLEMEITESLLADDSTNIMGTLKALRGMGVQLSIDDFGTGYSSFAYLKMFPIDTIKIDRAFICDMTEKEESASIVRAIIAMSHSLNLKVVGEGVEHLTQFDFLRELGCDLAQGYYLGRPMCAVDFEASLRSPTLDCVGDKNRVRAAEGNADT
ncbi:periplasmic sensor diguanylate cyclase/phosphodiesterase [Varunaivibrio sulfuroxidans]|uniref:Periplasmic sensor diguanylate cyclase/phosphodiesterase n=2 Tax=Varunaivibrio sulfuroxidans TaxID=1773489 RepID=A0A4V2UNW1_9PROT|nr:periplasmic sensor diguanylate cyclase/phosphodiesterase [Varunaivibrio sulfuroxidans]